MDELLEPKQTIYSALSEITSITLGSDEFDVEVFQQRPENLILDDFIAVTFFVNNNVPAYALSKDILNQAYEVTIDIYALSSLQSGATLKAVEEVMREIDYRLTFTTDVSDPSNYSHINTVFSF